MVRCGKKKCTISVCSVLLVIAIYALITNLFLEKRLKDTDLNDDAEVSEHQGGSIKHTNMNELRNMDYNIDGQNEISAITKVPGSISIALENKTSSKKHLLRNNIDHHIQSNEVDSDDCDWVNFKVKGPPYFLTVVFTVRIYESDKSQLKSTHLKQWLTYLHYAGVEHIYLYDLWYLPGESQREELDYFIREGFLTYTDRHDLNPFVRDKSLIPSLQQCIDEFGNETTWQAAIDIDEYPFSPEDTDPGFLYRFVKKYSEANPGVSEITMDNFIYLGQKDDTKELLIDKLWRHTHGPSNPLVKPIYKPADIKKAQVHHNHLRRGKSERGPNNSIRINHYWGARLQNWGPDTKEILERTEEDRGMESIVRAFKTCRPYLHL